MDWVTEVRERHPSLDDDWVKHIAMLASAIEVRVSSGASSLDTTIAALQRDPGVWTYPASIIAGLMSPDDVKRRDENARLRAQVGRLQDVAQKAHDAMMDWHFAHGNPSLRMSPEEAAMGEACKSIATALQETDDA